MSDDVRIAKSSRITGALDVTTAKRLSATIKATKAGEVATLQELQSEVKDIAVGKMNKWEKRKYLNEKFESLGGLVKKPKTHWTIAEGIKKKQLQREVKAYEEEKQMGLTGGADPLKRLKQEKAKAEEVRRKTDPFAKGLKFRQVGRTDKDGVLTLSKQHFKSVNKNFRNSRKDKIRIENVFRWMRGVIHQ